MIKNQEIGFQLIQAARECGDRASVQALFEYYEDSFKVAAMRYFNETPFDFEVSRLPNSDKHKQDVIFSEAYEAFVKAYKTYDASYGAGFETWLGQKIMWYFKHLRKMSAVHGERMIHYGEESEISEGGYILHRNEMYRRVGDLDKCSNASRSKRSGCDAAMVQAVLNSMPEKSAVRKNAEAMYRIFSEEGGDKQACVADRLGKTRQAVSKCFKSYREYGPKYLRDKVIETLRQDATRSSYATKSLKH